MFTDERDGTARTARVSPERDCATASGINIVWPYARSSCNVFALRDALTARRRVGARAAGDTPARARRHSLGRLQVEVPAALACFSILAIACVALAGAPDGRYMVDPRGVVYDTRTKLWWQQKPSDYSPICSGKYDEQSVAGDACAWDHANDYCAALSLAGIVNWRLPTRAELLTIVDRTEAHPAVDKEVFPGVPDDWFWSSTELAIDNSQAWLINFDYGTSSQGAKEAAGRVRCVH